MRICLCTLGGMGIFMGGVRGGPVLRAEWMWIFCVVLFGFHLFILFYVLFVFAFDLSGWHRLAEFVWVCPCGVSLCVGWAASLLGTCWRNWLVDNAGLSARRR